MDVTQEEQSSIQAQEQDNAYLEYERRQEETAE